MCFFSGGRCGLRAGTRTSRAGVDDASAMQMSDNARPLPFYGVAARTTRHERVQSEKKRPFFSRNFQKRRKRLPVPIAFFVATAAQPNSPVDAPIVLFVPSQRRRTKGRRNKRHLAGPTQDRHPTSRDGRSPTTALHKLSALFFPRFFFSSPQRPLKKERQKRRRSPRRPGPTREGTEATGKRNKARKEREREREMLHWPSSQRAPSIDTAPRPKTPPPKTPSVFDRWLADTGRRPARPPPARYTSRARRGADPTPGGPRPSLCLVWPDGRGPRAAATAPLFSFGPAAGAHDTTHDGRAKNDADHGNNIGGGDDDNNGGGEDRYHNDNDDARGDDDNSGDDDGDDYERYDPTLYMVDQSDWRKYIETRLGMGLTHHSVCNCTAGMPTRADVDHFAALLHEVVASHPELGAVESLGGYPETFVVLGAMYADVPRGADDTAQPKDRVA